MAQDYYETLGLKRGASDEEIRKAYREMARKYHPDLNQGDDAAKKKFQDVSRAFEVLGDAKKRASYDQFGPGFEEMGAGGPTRRPWPGGPGRAGAEPFEVDLNDLFGGGGPRGAGGFADIFKQFGGGRSTGAAPRKGADLEHEITIPFATAVSGGEAALSVQRADGATETITVKIPAGIEDGKKIRLRGQGDASAGGGAAGDLLLLVRVAPHPCFTRRGMNLDVTAPITLAEAATGAKVEIPTPHGSVTLTIPAGVSSGKKLRVKGQGVRPKGRPAGDLFVELQVMFPDGISDEDRAKIAEIAGDRPTQPRADLRW